MKEEKLKRRLVVEKALPDPKKKGSALPAILFIFLLCAAIVFVILEKLNYIDYVDFL